VFLRLCTHKESPRDFFRPEAYGRLIYESNVLNIPRILDLCVLFRGCNRGVLTKKQKKFGPSISIRFIKNVAQPGKNMQQTMSRNSFLSCWNYYYFLERTGNVQYGIGIQQAKIVISVLEHCRILFFPLSEQLSGRKILTGKNGTALD
jgi:hypothetical protein